MPQLTRGRGKIMLGVVSRFDDDKGYGEIKCGQQKLSVHYRAISSPHGVWKTLAEGDRVQLRMGRGRKGPRAKWVKKIIQ